MFNPTSSLYIIVVYCMCKWFMAIACFKWWLSHYLHSPQSRGFWILLWQLEIVFIFYFSTIYQFHIGSHPSSIWAFFSSCFTESSVFLINCRFSSLIFLLYFRQIFSICKFLCDSAAFVLGFYFCTPQTF